MEAKTSDNLSEQEKTLLENFRKCALSYKEHVIFYAETAASESLARWPAPNVIPIRRISGK